MVFHARIPFGLLLIMLQICCFCGNISLLIFLVIFKQSSKDDRHAWRIYIIKNVVIRNERIRDICAYLTVSLRKQLFLWLFLDGKGLFLCLKVSQL